MPKALLGLGVFSPLDIIQLASPYRDVINAVPHVNARVQNDHVQALPVLLAVADAIRHGHFLWWSPRVGAGAPIGALPFSGTQSPFNFALVVFPSAYGLAVATAARLMFAQLFTYLFLRRLDVTSPVATFGAVAYAFCGTNLVLLNRVGAYLILPALLWAAVRILEERRPKHIALMGLFGALAWLEGFPAGYVNVMAIVAAAAVPLVFVLGRADGAPRGAGALARHVGTGVIALAAGVALSAALVAFSVAPFESVASDAKLVSQRKYNSTVHLPAQAIPAVLSAEALGNPYHDSVLEQRDATGALSGAGNTVELGGAAGDPVALLALLALVAALAGRLALTRRTRVLLLGGLALVVAGVILIYLDTKLAGAFYRLPAIGNSPSNRIRIIINLGFVLMACAGLDGWLRHRWGLTDAPGDPPPASGAAAPGWIARAAIVLAVALLGYEIRPGVTIWWAWVRSNDAHPVRADLLGEAVGAVVVVGGALLALRFAAGKSDDDSRLASRGAFLALIAATFASLVIPLHNFTPTVNNDLVFPRTPGHVELAKLAGQRHRVLGSGLGTFSSNSSLRNHFLDLRGLAITTPGFKKLVSAALPSAFARDTTKVIYEPALDPANLQAPVLDDLGVRYIITGTNEDPYSQQIVSDPPFAGPLRSISTHPLRNRVSTVPGFAGLTLYLYRLGSCTGVPIIVRATTPTGRLLDVARRPAVDIAVPPGGPAPFLLAIPHAERPQEIRVTVSARGPACNVLSQIDPLGRVSVAERVLRRPGLSRLAATEEGLFYERPTAHDVVWLASTWSPQPSRDAALAAATAPSRRTGDPVPVSGAGVSPGAGAGAAPGSVEKISYGGSGFDVDVNAPGRSLLATGFTGRKAEGWTVKIDGHTAGLAAVDGELLGTVVPAGAHEIRFRYRPPRLLAGVALSLLALAVTVALLVLDRRRRAAPTATAASRDSL
jgi:hypothetical protein